VRKKYDFKNDMLEIFYFKKILTNLMNIISAEIQIWLMKLKKNYLIFEFKKKIFLGKNFKIDKRRNIFNIAP
jgi:hypothetical protein